MSKVKQYRKRPVAIEAMLWDGTSIDELQEFLDGYSHNFSSIPTDRKNSDGYLVHINTLEGVMTANVGDYVIKGVRGEFYPCKPDIFEATYEEVLL